MAKAKPSAMAPGTTWEANCLFCGEGITDEGEGFLTHMAAKPGCHEAYDHWVEELAHDWGGG